MKRLLAACAVATLSACASEPTPGDGYLHDSAFRRETLVRSLVNHENRYSQQRIARYETGKQDDWARLPEWNPRVWVLTGDGERPLESLALEGIDEHDEGALVALGERAFFRYPVQNEPAFESGVSSSTERARLGLWSDQARGLGGLVRVEVPSGARPLAFTCSTCHAKQSAGGGALVVGAGNDRLDVGLGPGRIDVTTADGSEPVRIADLRPMRWLTHLHAGASVLHRDRASLAVRIETLVTTGHHESSRPPRIVALALAAYLESLADTLPDAPAPATAVSRGASLFQEHCSRCHSSPGFTGPPVPVDVVGTDPVIATSLERGTGTYRVPSLRGVATRGALLHDASVPSVTALLDPARLQRSWTGSRLGQGAVPGHVFGLSLDASDRADLARFVEAL